MGNTETALAELTAEQLNLLQRTRTKFLIERRSSNDTRLSVRMHGQTVDEKDFEALLRHRLLDLDITTAIPSVRGETTTAHFYKDGILYQLTDAGRRALEVRTQNKPGQL